LLSVAVYVNTSLHSLVLREANIVSSVKALSERFVDPIHHTQNSSLIKSIEAFRSIGYVSSMQAPAAISWFSESININQANSHIDESLSQLKNFRPRAGKAAIESLYSELNASHMNHRQIILYLNILVGLGFITVFAFLLRRLSELTDAVHLANEYMELSEQTSYFSEHDHLEEENGFEEYVVDDNDQEDQQNQPDELPETQTLGLEQHLQAVLSEEIERTGHLATLHDSAISDELLPAEYLPTIKTIFESLVRNAVQHGGRRPQERELVRKDKTMSVFIGLEETRGEYTLTVADDGEGISGSNTRKHALIRKLISPEVANALSDDKAARLIFLPGFSPNESQENNLSLEQLRTLIRDLNGSIGMQNKEGDLCKFIIRLPKRNA